MRPSLAHFKIVRVLTRRIRGEVAEPHPRAVTIGLVGRHSKRIG